MKSNLLFVFFLVFLLSLSHAANAQTETYIETISYTLEQPFGGKSTITSAAEYIQTVYQFALGMVGIVAVFLIMYGGLNWVTAGGNEQKIGEAKETILSAIFGLLLALLSYAILTFISPRLVEQNLSIAKISVPNTSDYLWELDWCTENKFTGKECSANSGTYTCKEVPCGEAGVVEGGVCRGAVCEAGDNEPGCYRSPNNPQGEASCQPKTCGQWATSCYNKYPNPENSQEFKNCACSYYQEVVMPLMGASGDPDDYLGDSDETQKARTQFSVFCNENATQEKLVDDIVADNARGTSGTYTFTGDPAQVKNYVWNCNFGCQLYQGAEEVEEGEIFVSEIIECRGI